MPHLTPEVNINLPSPSKDLMFVSIIIRGENKLLINPVKSMYPRGFDSVSMIHILLICTCMRASIRYLNLRVTFDFSFERLFKVSLISL